ncbi:MULTISPECIES: GIN domain-containing protein [unclassified Janthinobacterium]|uniref:GIN domain-containing protein n=1 Tax=unclassified Janthinobacterium TaxID=2610881 RepID=UPI001611A661|nr:MULTISPECIES: DUF2807 domain-containing protein [unclassified Janthinobacterium]MBB5606024.1 hypothetical protein [Janthinobacterium sp. S3T4]MBB5611058.1 hypothetical protein [Janthinobacterium sp. S3M3]
MRRLALFAALPLALLSPVHAGEQTRVVGAFNAIDIRGPISIEIESGKEQSLILRGDQQFISGVITEVVDGELKISMKDKNIKKTEGDPRIIVTVPALRKLIAEGAGEKILTRLSGPRVDISYKGAGRLSADGQVDWLRLKAQGVGEVDTKALLAKNVDVNFDGIGSVKVYSSGELNAVVRGMGELVYYGKPKIVHKSISGIGSVTAAK